MVIHIFISFWEFKKVVKSEQLKMERVNSCNLKSLVYFCLRIYCYRAARRIGSKSREGNEDVNDKPYFTLHTGIIASEEQHKIIIEMDILFH